MLKSEMRANWSFREPANGAKIGRYPGHRPEGQGKGEQMYKRIRIEKLAGDCAGLANIPLPWGIVELETCRFYGSLYSSRGGAWYWRLPREAIVGYGEFRPYADFYFTGTVERCHRRDDIPESGWGWRHGDRCWVYLVGKISPTWQTRIEELLSHDIRMKRGFVPSAQSERQGHLELIEVGGETPARVVVRRLNGWKDGPLSRRRIFNHQFFGDCDIFWVRSPDGIERTHFEKEGMWLVNVRDKTFVVSPDHTNRPIVLFGGWYLARHPWPAEETDND